LVVVLSDLFSGSTAGPEDLLHALGHLRHKKHELIVLQVLDQAELTFPFRDAGQIENIETGLSISSDADAVRNHYLQQLNAYLDELRNGCLSRKIGYSLTDTTQPFDLFLGTYLTRRQQQTVVRTAR